ncbi:MAG TPA: DNA polymerase III subunit beta [Trueperaceae bacterium]
MKVHVSKNHLADVLGHVERIVPARSSNPGLSLVKLELAEDSLIFSGSNMDMDIETRVTADVTGEGAVAVPAQVFGQVVRALPGDQVELSLDEKEMEIVSGPYSTKLQLVDASQAPVINFTDDFGGELDGADLVTALSNVRYAAATADYQAIFRGVKLELADNHTRAVASDGFRLAYYHLDSSSGLDANLVLPARSVEELVRILDDGAARLAVGEGQLMIATPSTRLNVKLMEGSFPDYERVIPSSFPVSVTTNAKALSEAVSRVALMADRTTNNRVDMFVKDGTMQITAEGAFGRAQEAVTVNQEGSDPEIAVAFNAKYLVDAVSPLTGQVSISLSRETAPSVMVNPEKPGYLAMVVPLRTG